MDAVKDNTNTAQTCFSLECIDSFLHVHLEEEMVTVLATV